MEKNFLSKVLENENRINKIVEVLALSPADHFNLSFTNQEVEIDAYTHKFAESEQTANLMRCFSTPQDHMETVELENTNGKFWVTKLNIGI